jgi:formylmethanofuran dehydrogenase subunit E
MMNIGDYSFEEYIEMVKSFHGHVAPGLVIGGFMVDLALKNIPKGELIDAVCETRSCLPDAIQLLTPCTIGNGWLRVVNLGRYALTLYEKYEGKGIRVFMDSAKVEAWPEIKSWFFKLKPKKDQDFQLLMSQIREAGSSICSTQQVRLQPNFIKKQRRGGFTTCPLCNEAYPTADGGICRACQGEAPYVECEVTDARERNKMPRLKDVPLEQAVGRHALSDMTRIIPGKEKGPAFKRGQLITAGDICRLQQMGRENILTAEDNPDSSEWVHEDEAALAFSRAMAGDGVIFTDAPSEGKADLLAARDGLLMVDDKRLETFNLIPGVMCGSRHGYTVVDQGFKLAGTRAIPLFLPRKDFHKAMTVLADGPLFEVLPLRKARVGILVTGTEVFRGLVEDKFIPIISNKVKKYGCLVVKALIAPDDRQTICNGIKDLLDARADLVVTTAGLSVDPDDVTRQALADAGAADMLYGTPILPGAMTLLAHINAVQVIGVPACALYFKTTSFDLLLPRLLAGLEVSRRDLARLSSRAFCLACKTCTFPKCPFGK